MAFSGLHVVCAYAGSVAPQRHLAPTLGRPIWSESFAAPGTTSQKSPGSETQTGDAVFHIRSSEDAWVSLGEAPDPENDARIFVPANEFVTVYTKVGDKLAWIAA